MRGQHRLAFGLDTRSCAQQGPDLVGAHVGDRVVGPLQSGQVGVHIADGEAPREAPHHLEHLALDVAARDVHRCDDLGAERDMAAGITQHLSQGRPSVLAQPFDIRDIFQHAALHHLQPLCEAVVGEDFEKATFSGVGGQGRDACGDLNRGSQELEAMQVVVGVLRIAPGLGHPWDETSAERCHEGSARNPHCSPTRVGEFAPGANAQQCRGHCADRINFFGHSSIDT